VQHGTSERERERGDAIYLDAVLELGVVVHLAAEVDDDEVLRVILLKKASHV
jgi:hypothetical protein